MKNIDPSKALEPAGGDFVAYLKKLEQGKINELGGLHISLPDGAQDGMVVVQTTEEIAGRAYEQAQESRAASEFKRANLMIIAGFALGVLGLVMITAGSAMRDTLEIFIPFGMVAVFAAVVLSAEGKKRKKRLSGE